MRNRTFTVVISSHSTFHKNEYHQKNADQDSRFKGIKLI